MKNPFKRIDSEISAAANAHPLLMASASVVVMLITLMLLIGISNDLSRTEGKIHGTQTVVLAIKIKTMFSHGTFDGLDPAVLITAKTLPSKMVNGESLINRFGGRIDVQPASIEGGHNNGFVIMSSDVPRAACAGVVETLRASDALRIRVYEAGDPSPHSSDACVGDDLTIESEWS